MASNVAIELQHRNIAVVRSALQGFHLSEMEGVVYAAVLNLGPRPAGIIAKHTGLNRSYTYDVLASLSKKGLLRETEKKGVKHFNCTTPEELLVTLEAREREVASQKESLKNSLPELNRLRLKPAPSPSNEPARDFDQLAELFDDMVTEDLLFGAPGPMIGLLSDEMMANAADAHDTQLQFARWRETHGVRYQIIAANENLAMMLPRNTLTEVRILSNLQMPSGHIPSEQMPPGMIVFRDRVALIGAEQERRSVVLDSAQLAESLRAMHAALWSLLSVSGPA